MAKEPRASEVWTVKAAADELGLSRSAFKALEYAAQNGVVGQPLGSGQATVTLDQAREWFAAYTPGKRGPKPRKQPEAKGE